MAPTQLPEAEVHALMRAEHGDPFGVLGPHETARGLVVRALLPGAQGVTVLHARSGWPLATLERHEGSDLFAGLVPAAQARMGYAFQVDWGSHVSRIDDPYRFPFVLGDTDIWLLAEGTHLRPWERLGAHLREMDGVKGVAFAVWAPNARRVSVVGDFNNWDGRRHMMRLRRECGVWEVFAPHVAVGDAYEFEILSAQGELLRKADPFAFSSRLAARHRLARAPRCRRSPRLGGRRADDHVPCAQRARCADQRSTRCTWARGGARTATNGMGYIELAHAGADYVSDMGFTHIELLPITEHPFDGSWGYQPIGLLCAHLALRHPERLPLLRRPRLHAAGLGVILDWVPSHFPTDAHGLGLLRRHARCTSTPIRARASTTTGTRRSSTGRAPRCAATSWATALFWLEQVRHRRPARGRRGLDALPRLQPRPRRMGAQCAGRAREPRGDRVPAAAQSRGLPRRPGAFTDRRGIDQFSRSDAPARGRTGWASALQVEHGLDERHAGLHAQRPGASAAPPPRAHLLAGLCFTARTSCCRSRTTRWCTARAR
jgi:hypothetical protein